MGACIEKGREPLLVMEHMENGSLYSLLHNGTMEMDRDVVIPIIKDIVAGERAVIGFALNSNDDTALFHGR